MVADGRRAAELRDAPDDAARVGLRASEGSVTTAHLRIGIAYAAVAVWAAIVVSTSWPFFDWLGTVVLLGCGWAVCSEPS